MASRTRSGRCGVCVPSAKRQALLELGAAHVIASTEEDLAARLGEIADTAGVRVVLDPIGGPPRDIAAVSGSKIDHVIGKRSGWYRVTLGRPVA